MEAVSPTAVSGHDMPHAFLREHNRSSMEETVEVDDLDGSTKTKNIFKKIKLTIAKSRK